MQNDFDAIRADIARIPGTPEGDQIIARMINGQDPIKRLLASLEANRRARTRQQAKTPQMQQGRPPVAQEKAQQLLASGIGSLPVSEDMYSPRTMAGGGIVAFEDGGEVKHFDGRWGSQVGTSRFLSDEERLKDLESRPLTAAEIRRGGRRDTPTFGTAAAVRSGFVAPPTSLNNKLPSMDDTVAFMGDVPVVVSSPSAANLAKPPVSSGKPDVKPPAEAPVDPLAAYEAYLKGDAGADKTTRDEARNMALLEAGLNIMGGDSPYAMQNIGKGAAAGARGYGERLAELRKDRRARAKELAEFGLTKAKMAQDKELAELQRKTQKEVASIYADARSGEGGYKENQAIEKSINARVKQLGGEQIAKQIAMFSIGTPSEKTKSMIANLEQQLKNIRAQAEDEVYRAYKKEGGGSLGAPRGKLVQNKDGTLSYQP